MPVGGVTLPQLIHCQNIDITDDAGIEDYIYKQPYQDQDVGIGVGAEEASEQDK